MRNFLGSSTRVHEYTTGPTRRLHASNHPLIQALEDSRTKARASSALPWAMASSLLHQGLSHSLFGCRSVPRLSTSYPASGMSHELVLTSGSQGLTRVESNDDKLAEDYCRWSTGSSYSVGHSVRHSVRHSVLSIDKSYLTRMKPSTHFRFHLSLTIDVSRIQIVTNVSAFSSHLTVVLYGVVAHARAINHISLS